MRPARFLSTVMLAWRQDRREVLGPIMTVPVEIGRDLAIDRLIRCQQTLLGAHAEALDQEGRCTSLKIYREVHGGTARIVPLRRVRSSKMMALIAPPSPTAFSFGAGTYGYSTTHCKADHG